MLRFSLFHAHLTHTPSTAAFLHGNQRKTTGDKMQRMQEARKLRSSKNSRMTLVIFSRRNCSTRKTNRKGSRPRRERRGAWKEGEYLTTKNPDRDNTERRSTAQPPASQAAGGGSRTHLSLPTKNSKEEVSGAGAHRSKHDLLLPFSFFHSSHWYRAVCSLQKASNQHDSREQELSKAEPSPARSLAHLGHCSQ